MINLSECRESHKERHDVFRFILFGLTERVDYVKKSVSFNGLTSLASRMRRRARSFLTSAFSKMPLLEGSGVTFVTWGSVLHCRIWRVQRHSCDMGFGASWQALSEISWLEGLMSWNCFEFGKKCKFEKIQLFCFWFLHSVIWISKKYVLLVYEASMDEFWGKNLLSQEIWPTGVFSRVVEIVSDHFSLE